MRLIRRRSLGITIALATVLCASPWTAGTRARAQAAQANELKVLVASPADPSLHGFVVALKQHPYFVANAGRISVAEVSAGAISTGGKTGATVSVYRHSAAGFQAAGTRSRFTRTDEVAQWVASLDARPTTNQAARTDPDLVRTNWDKSLPTPQAAPQTQMPYVPAQAAPPQPPPQPQFTQPSSVPMMMVPQAMMVPQQSVQTMSLAPASAPANVIQAPSQHYIIQQAPPQFFFAQQAQTAPASLAPASLAPAPMAPANLFMPASVAPATTPAPMPMMAAAPASMPMMAVAPASMPMMAVAPASMPMMAVAPSAVAPAAVGPAVSGASVTTQSVSIPASSTRSRVRVRGPGPLGAFAARVGERLTTLGRTRIETIQETNLETQTSAPPPGQVVTLSSTSASPVMAPPQQQITVPTSIPVSPPPPSPPMPTPQGPFPSPQSHEKHHFWGHN